MSLKRPQFIEDFIAKYLFSFDEKFTSEEQDFLNHRSDLIIRYFDDFIAKFYNDEIVTLMSFSVGETEEIRTAINFYSKTGNKNINSEQLIRVFLKRIDRDLTFKLKYIISLGKCGNNGIAIEDLIGLDELGLDINICKAIYLYNISELGKEKPLRVAQEFSRFTEDELSELPYFKPSFVDEIKNAIHARNICLANEDYDTLFHQRMNAKICQQIIDSANALIEGLSDVKSHAQENMQNLDSLDLPLDSYYRAFNLINGALMALKPEQKTNSSKVK